MRIFAYFLLQIYSNIRLYHYFWYEYIRIYVRTIFLIRIYSYNRSYCFFDTNIFGYSFVLFFSIRTYSDIRSYQNFIFVTLWFQMTLMLSEEPLQCTRYATFVCTRFAHSVPLSAEKRPPVSVHYVVHLQCCLNLGSDSESDT